MEECPPSLSLGPVGLVDEGPQKSVRKVHPKRVHSFSVAIRNNVVMSSVNCVNS